MSETFVARNGMFANNSRFAEAANGRYGESAVTAVWVQPLVPFLKVTEVALAAPALGAKSSWKEFPGIGTKPLSSPAAPLGVMGVGAEKPPLWV